MHFAGDLSILTMPRVAVVGTRKPSREGVTRTEAIVARLVAAGAAIVSGGALGVDTIAHRVAIDAGGRTVAILPCALTEDYPPSNAKLFAYMREFQLIISQFEPNSTITKQHFILRNYTICDFAQTVIITEAGPISGTRHVAARAIRTGKRLFISKSSCAHSWSLGAVADGAIPLEAKNFHRIFEGIA